MASFAERLNLEYRIQISEKLNKLPLSYFDKHKRGEIISMVTSDLDKISETMQYGLLRLFTSIGMLIGSIIMMLRFSVLLTIVFFITTIISLFLTKQYSML